MKSPPASVARRLLVDWSMCLSLNIGFGQEHPQTEYATSNGTVYFTSSKFLVLSNGVLMIVERG